MIALAACDQMGDDEYKLLKCELWFANGKDPFDTPSYELIGEKLPWQRSVNSVLVADTSEVLVLLLTNIRFTSRWTSFALNDSVSPIETTSIFDHVH